MRRIGLAGLLLCVLFLISRVFAHPTQNGFEVLYGSSGGETLTGAYSGLIITNLNASGIQTLNLPPAVAGMRFIFALSAAQRITVNPDNNDLFIGTGISPAPSAGQALQSDQVVGSLREIVAVNDANWLVIRKVGTWTNAG